MANELHLTNQVIGDILNAYKLQREAEKLAALTAQHQALLAALKSVQGVRVFVSDPDRILGSSLTKHGEIAEQVEVGIRNAWDQLYQRLPSATFEGVGRTAPEDYLINGIQVQSKFVNGISANLDHVLTHMHKYPYFGRDGSYYHIPKEHYQVIEKLLNGELVEGLSCRTVERILKKLQEIERLSEGRSIQEVVRPSISGYGEVQLGRIHQTLKRHEDDLRTENRKQNHCIEESYQPILGDALGAAGNGAAIGAGFHLTISLYNKTKEGKNPFLGQFTVQDWQEIGLDAGKGAAQGGVSAGGIYALTQYPELAAPFAAAFVSTAMMVGSLAKQFRDGDLDLDEFVDLGMFACSEGAIVGITTFAGQSLIPLPVVGPLIGAVSGRFLVLLAKHYLGEDADALDKKLSVILSNGLITLEQEYQALVKRMLAEYDTLYDLTQAAFDPQNNIELRIQSCILLARAYGVPEEHIIHNSEELDRFIQSS